MRDLNEELGDSAFTATTPHDYSMEPPYSGALSFLRRPYQRDLRGADVAIVGVPYDLATTGRPGARFGPQAIRLASGHLSWNMHYPSGANLYRRVAAVDAGDILFDSGKPELVPTIIEKKISSLLEQGPKILALGGDHFVTYPILKAHYARFGPLALVHFDAHSDTWEDKLGRIDHGTMFWHAAREGIVRPEHSIQIGIRTHNPQTHGFRVVGMAEFERLSLGEVLDLVLTRVGDRPCYVTFDIDGLDPAFAPGTGTPVVGGLSTREALVLLQGLTPLNLVGMDVVEVAPAYDTAGITALAGATVAMQFLWLVAQKKKSAPKT